MWEQGCVDTQKLEYGEMSRITQRLVNILIEGRRSLDDRILPVSYDVAFFIVNRSFTYDQEFLQRALIIK